METTERVATSPPERAGRLGVRSRRARFRAARILALGVALASAIGCASSKPPVPVEIHELGPRYLEQRVEVTGVLATLEHSLDGYGMLAFDLVGLDSSIRCCEEGWNVVLLSDLASRLAGAKDRGDPVTVRGVYATGADDLGRITERLEIEAVRVGATMIDSDYGDSSHGSGSSFVY